MEDEEDEEADEEDEEVLLYEDVPLEALSKLAEGNEKAGLEWLQVLEQCETTERHCAEVHREVARVAKMVSQVGTAHAAAGEVARSSARRADAHAKTAERLAAAAAACRADAGATSGAAARSAVAAAVEAERGVVEERKKLRGRVGSSRMRHRLALRESYRRRDVRRDEAAKACLRADAGRAAMMEKTCRRLLEAERAHLSARLQGGKRARKSHL